MPTVTIGIPVRNEVAFLRETIEAALSQKFQDIEVVISDNASDDGSWEIIQEFSENDGRIRAFRQPTDVGALENFRFCLRKASSPFFVWLGGHDLFLEDYIGHAVDFLRRNPEYVMFYPRSRLFDGNEKALGYEDSNIDTSGLSVVERMKKVAGSLRWCTSIHGVFRTHILRMLPLKKMRGPDQLLIFAASSFGHIHFSEYLGIVRRESVIRTPDETDQKRKNAGVFEEPRCKYYNSYTVFSLEHLLFVVKSTRMPLYRRALLAVSVARILKRRLAVGYISTILAFAGEYMARNPFAGSK